MQTSIYVFSKRSKAEKREEDLKMEGWTITIATTKQERIDWIPQVEKGKNNTVRSKNQELWIVAGQK